MRRKNVKSKGEPAEPVVFPHFHQFNASFYQTYYCLEVVLYW